MLGGGVQQVKADTDEGFCYASYVQSASTAQRIKQLKDEIKTIEEAIRKYRKIKHPGYPSQKAYEDRRSDLLRFSRRFWPY